jgi:hypothetical protein
MTGLSIHNASAIMMKNAAVLRSGRGKRDRTPIEIGDSIAMKSHDRASG